MFKLEIRLGNAAMQSCDDVSRALSEVAKRLAGRSEGDDHGRIRDDNGNTVGEWSIAGASVDDEDES